MNPIIVHTSDTQIKNWNFGGTNPETGLNRRFEDALACLDYVIDYAIDSKARYFIHSGDVNEERNPDSIAIEQFAIRVKKLLDSNIKVILVAGNHDIDSAKGCTTSISYLKTLDIPNLYISDTKIETFEFDDGVRFLCLPYFTKTQMGFSEHGEITDYLIDAKRDFMEKSTHENTNVVIAHYSTDKVFEGFQLNEATIPVGEFQDVDYLALGHIHDYIMYDDNDVVGGYCGSPYKVTFGEKTEKYFNVFNCVNGQILKVHVPNREFLDLQIDAMSVDSTVVDKYVKEQFVDLALKGVFVKVTVKCHKKFNPKIVYDYLRSKEVFDFMPMRFDIQKAKSSNRIELKDGIDDVGIVSSFLSKQIIDANLKENALRLFKKVFEKVEHGGDE